jgi:hypothetical protein
VPREQIPLDDEQFPPFTVPHRQSVLFRIVGCARIIDRRILTTNDRLRVADIVVDTRPCRRRA